ncbi:hypothetical protein M2459_000405 [Parabacteroides sp. PF5-5]|uniref:hypothetical protein n=1 Tax=unclassified Parabacteroides TaxID=2649774 RepID=UPI0024736755|nr:MULTISPECIES: hypothetical protein [unclassified Parabacteroides]MDH6303661.1 hypothetical protein [Parabacteroides sp. PH5-39]MDH6314983.1 hypothetical protein [Parabacteroides sp. PF5-13]MDH6318320.1 hypothetical protein [Parabacteroides sp. PH5-13]MDH6321747.1 hypothetical protein [Parabacteroides sp. PH5-8]MDH6325871.1 hypothetical protein [Parabacteroides sp. PH5-41]
MKKNIFIHIVSAIFIMTVCNGNIYGQTKVIGSASATFNVTTRNVSQSITGENVQTNAKAALIQEATKKFPNATDVININVARQSSETWMDGYTAVLSVEYVATGQVIGYPNNTSTSTSTPLWLLGNWFETETGKLVFGTSDTGQIVWNNGLIGNITSIEGNIVEVKYSNGNIASITKVNDNFIRYEGLTSGSKWTAMKK